MRKVSGDNTDQFDHLFRLYYADLCAFALRYLHSESQAEDLVSETFYTLWKSREALGKIDNIKAYLFKSVRNNCLYYLRSQKNKPQIQDVDFSLLEPQSILVKNAMDTLILKELAEQLMVLIEDLPPQQQKIFKMKRFDNKKNKEIADELNLSVKTVEMHVSKATSTLRTKLKSYLPSLIILYYLLSR